MKKFFKIVEASVGSLATNRLLGFFAGLAKVFVGKNMLGSVVKSFFLCNALCY